MKGIAHNPALHPCFTVRRGVRRSSRSLYCKYGKKRKPPIMLASLGCFFTHLSYSLRMRTLQLGYRGRALPSYMKVSGFGPRM
jgi:hypothetical protein